jgi:hypothetical protein
MTGRKTGVLGAALILTQFAVLSACSGGDASAARDGGAADGGPADGSDGSGGSSGSGQAGLEIAGVYRADDAEVEGLVWLGGAVQGAPGYASWHVRFDNGGNWLIWQSQPALTGGVAQFGRFVWLEPTPEGVVHGCNDVTEQQTADEAEAAPQSADPSDLQTGCNGEPWLRLTPAEPSPLSGTWRSNFGGSEVVTPIAFDGLALVSFGGDTTLGPDAAGWVVVRNPEDDAFNPGKYAKVVWTGDGDGFAYCFVDFGLDSAALAEASTLTADAGDLDGQGCGGFAWTRLEPQGALDISGVYATNFGGFEVIDTARWAGVDVVAFDNTARWAVTQNAWDAEYAPSAYNKLVWTAPVQDGGLHYCTVTFGEPGQALARDTTKTADEGDLDGEGCGGFPWTKLTPVFEP